MYCTDIGCNDGATITLDSPSGSWAAGGYELRASGDGIMVSCTLNIPAPATNDVFGTCTTTSTTSAASLALEFARTCMAFDSGISGVAGIQCTPIPGQSSLKLAVPGTAANLTLVLTREGTQLASESVALQYNAYYPNGQACGGACQEASATITVAGAGSAATGSGDAGTDSGPDV